MADIGIPNAETSVVPQEPLTLPEVKITANPAPPVGHINVLNPEGKLGHVPVEWLLKEGKDKGYTLPPDESHQPNDIDLTPDKQVKVVRKSDGTPGTVPLEWYVKDPGSVNYQPASKADVAALQLHKQLVDQNLENLLKTGWKELGEQHKNDDVQDKDGNYKLLAPSGDPVSVPHKDLTPLLLSGFKFQDDNFQALVDAHLSLADTVKKKEEAGYAGYVGSLPGFEHVRNALTSSSWSTTIGKAQTIANQQLEADKLSTAHGIGVGLGIAAQLAIPAGSFAGLIGKPGLAATVGGATLAKLAPEGASLGRQILARTAAGALEGVVVTAPQTLARTAIDEDFKGAAESLALGAGIGAVLGGTIKIVGGLAGKGAELVSPLMADRALREAGATEEAINSFANAEQKQSFLLSLKEKGLNKTSSGEQVGKVLQELGEGERIAPLLEKLDKVGEPLSAGTLSNDILKVGSDFVKLNEKAAPVVDQLSEKLSQMADKSGNISLQNLQKFAQEVGADINWNKAVDISEVAKMKVWNSALEQLLIAGDKAAQTDAKLAEAWSNGKAVTEISKQMHDKLIGDIVSGNSLALNPIAKFIKAAIVHSAEGTGFALGGFGGGYVANRVVKPFISEGANFAESQILQHYAANPANDSKLTNWLVKNKTSSAIGSYLTLDAIKTTASKNREIPTFIRNLAEKTPAMFLAIPDPIKAILGNEANGLSKDQQFRRLSERAAQMSGSPDLRNQHLQELLAPVMKEHPEFAAQVQQDYENKINILNQILHQKNTKELTPFQKQEKYVPSKSDMKDIEDQLRVALNPYVLLDGLKNGKISAKQVAIASQLNPALLSQIREEMNKSAYAGKTTLTYQQRLAASVIMGEAMDQSLKATTQLQVAYQPMQLSPGGGGKAPKMNAQKMPSAQPTLSQRLMNK